MALKIVITGGSGLLGKYLLKTQPMISPAEGCFEPEYEITPCYRNNKIDGIKLDVSNFSNVIDVLFTIQPDIIIHCACNGDVDNVEEHPSEAVKADLLGVIHLKDFAEKMRCKLIIISSNAVFDGDNPPYSEDSPRNPVNFYGKIKSLADDIIMKSSCEWMIVRPIFMYGWPNEGGRENWATKIIKSLKDGKELRLVTDSFTQPTYAGDVAEDIWSLIKHDWNRVYNVASKEKSTIFNFGLRVADIFNLDYNKINRAKLKDFKTIAPRPIDTTFEVSDYGPVAIEEGLQKMKDENN